jgi:cell division protein FtsL
MQGYVKKFLIGTAISLAATAVILVAIFIVALKTSGLTFAQVKDLKTHFDYLNKNNKQAQSCQKELAAGQGNLQAQAQKMNDPGLKNDPSEVKLTAQQQAEAQAALTKVQTDCQPVIAAYQQELAYYVKLGQEISQKKTWLGELLSQIGIGNVDADAIAKFQLDNNPPDANR